MPRSAGWDQHKLSSRPVSQDTRVLAPRLGGAGLSRSLSPWARIPPAPLLLLTFTSSSSFCCSSSTFRVSSPCPARALEEPGEATCQRHGGKEASPHPAPEAPRARSLTFTPTMRPLTRGCICSSTKLTFLLTEVSLSGLLEEKRTKAKVRGGKRWQR